MHVYSFAPIVNGSSRVLILGSMPGKVSLHAGEYYAHPRNRFWHVMEVLFDVRRSLLYEERIAGLVQRGISLWDVLASCTRETSLDSDIVASSIVPNDFGRLLEKYPSVGTICFNGGKAASAFRQHVLPRLDASRPLALHALPSTSPANTSMTFENKVESWRVVVQAVENTL